MNLGRSAYGISLRVPDSLSTFRLTFHRLHFRPRSKPAVFKEHLLWEGNGNCQDSDQNIRRETQERKKDTQQEVQTRTLYLRSAPASIEPSVYEYT